MKQTGIQRKVELLGNAVSQLRSLLEQGHTQRGADAKAFVPLSAKEFAARVGRSAGWVRREVRQRRIRGYGRPLMIPRSELLRFI